MPDSRSRLSVDRREEMHLFRFTRGFPANLPGAKGVCRSNASGPQRFSSGTNLLEFGCAGTGVAAECPMFTRIIILNDFF